MKAAKNPTTRATATPKRKPAVSKTVEKESPVQQSTPDPPSSEPPKVAPPAISEDGVILIDPAGDLVLKVEHDSRATKGSHSFRLGSSLLKSESRYFERLLQSGRFEEAAKVEQAHKSLRERYGDPAQAPTDQLPVLDIRELGRISDVKALDALLTDFFLMLYGRDLQAPPPAANLANLAIVADRFDALVAIRSYVARKKLIQAIDRKTTSRLDAALSEEKVRQRLLTATLLDYLPWMEKYSLRIILKGWTDREINSSQPLWWDLPSRIEEELGFRRECVLETIQSIQMYFLGLYTSRERQCKLGYDSSGQCDSFQLGEMVRFFTRMGTVEFRSTLFDTSELAPPHDGDIVNLLDSLRQCPEYQIDKFHSHCGIRTRLIPLLDLLQECLQGVGICAECWQNDRQEYAWIQTKKPLLWKRSLFRPRGQGCRDRHAGLRELFTAAERDWSS